MYFLCFRLGEEEEGVMTFGRVMFSDMVYTMPSPGLSPRLLNFIIV
jgi:hypothetical protein